jgi:hypothetical protein
MPAGVVSPATGGLSAVCRAHWLSYAPNTVASASAHILGGLDQITEHHCKLPTFRAERRRYSRERCDRQGGLLLGSRLWCCLSRWSGDFVCPCNVASPNETSSFVIDDWVNIEDFFLQVLDIVVIDIKVSLYGTIRYPSLAFEEVNDLGKNFIEGHR